MSMYFVHNNLSTYSDNIFKSVFLFKKESSNDENRISDDPIWIKLKDDSIEFFLVVDQIDNPVVVHYHSHLFTLPLDSPERTDYFLNNGWNKNNGLCPNTEHPYYLTQKSLNEYPLPELKIIHRLFLCLFDELNNSGSDINKYSPKVSFQIKLKLEKSPVYQLIRKKYNFYKVLFEWKTDNIKSKEGDVKAFYNEFLDVILKDTFAKVIPVQKFSSDNWFQNPQQELEQLIQINTKHSIDPSSEKNIQNYLLKKHAILKAFRMTFNSSVKWIIASQIISFLCFILVLILWQFQKYENTSNILVFGVIIFLVPIFYAIIKSKKTNLIMPRILVAMGLVLYAIVGSEVILKNQFLIDLTTVKIVFYSGLLIVTSFIYYECRQHSPYYMFKQYMKIRVFPILIYSFNLAVILVILSQLIVSHKFIDNSKVISSSVFANEFKELGSFRDQYLGYQDKIRKAKEQCEFITFLTMKQDFVFKNSALDSQKIVNCVLALNKKINNIEKINQHIYSLNNLYKMIKEITPIKKDIEDRKLKDILLWGINDLSPSQLYQNRSSHNVEAIFNILHDLKKLNIADSICNSISNSLTMTYDLYKETPKILDSFLTYKKVDKIDSKIKYGFYFKPDRVYIVKLPFGLPSIYPNMVMLQVIIVMLIGLVGQLIISDKTVTEPL